MRFILCADGGGSKVNVVIKSVDGLEVRGSAGPSNSVGYTLAVQSLLLATYRALAQLPPTMLPSDLVIPPLEPVLGSHLPFTQLAQNQLPTPPSSVGSASFAQQYLPPVMNPIAHGHQQSLASLPLSLHPANLSPNSSRPTTPATVEPRLQPRGHTRTKLPPINTPIFRSAWLGLAGISCRADEEAFARVIAAPLGLDESRVKVTNALSLHMDHVLALVAGTGTVGRTIKVREGRRRGLPLEDVAVVRGWGYLTNDPLDLISIASLTSSGMVEEDEGEATSRRNALIAGAARIVFKWAFPEDEMLRGGSSGMPTPPGSEGGDSDRESMVGQEEEMETASHLAALHLAKQAIKPLVELVLSLLGDQTVVKPHRSVLALGGGLMMSEGYRRLLLDGLAKQGILFGRTVVVRDAAGEGARGLGRVEWG
ncbi:uncharacterized protein L203_104323 [Cryptococcus depauperatus CBS 7841]|uniref:N-acetyl-D-glucosamine kinase n=1 Tax=Cryptococcus depauperatus CBS 7841 TaxID=1295531 RepID=A0AAJ8JVA6_9TREE